MCQESILIWIFLRYSGPNHATIEEKGKTPTDFNELGIIHIAGCKTQ